MIREFSVVIYTGNAGGAGEYPASNDPNAALTHIIEAGLPPGARVVEAWYTPMHNIPALNAFAFIDVNRHNDTQVSLSVAGFAGQDGQRLRIKIHVFFTR